MEEKRMTSLPAPSTPFQRGGEVVRHAAQIALLFFFEFLFARLR